MSLAILWNLIPLVVMALVVVLIHWLSTMPQVERKKRGHVFDRQRLANHDAWVIGAMLVGTALLAFGWQRLLWWCTGKIASEVPGGVYWVAHSSTLLIVPAVVLGMVSACLFAGLVLWGVLRSEFGGYRAAFLARMGDGGVRWLRSTCLWLTAASMLLALAGTGWYTVFTRDAILVDRPWSPVAFSYPYSQLDHVRLIAFPIDDNTNHYYYELEFSNGEKVRTDGVDVNTIPAYDLIFNYVAETSNLPVEKEFNWTRP
jgi:hypothetical protein